VGKRERQAVDDFAMIASGIGMNMLLKIQPGNGVVFDGMDAFGQC